MTTIYVIRHGETDSNIRRTCLGHKDEPLNDTGKQQAEELAKRLSGVKCDAVYSSPLDRAINTIAPVIKGNINATMSFALIERDFGIWDDMTFEEIQAKYPEEYDRWQKDFTGYRIEGGESSEDVQKRINTFMDKLVENHKDQCVFVVTHLGAARHIISHLLGLTIEQSWLFALDNAKCAVIELDDEGNGLLKGLNI